jgi:integrase
MLLSGHRPEAIRKARVEHVDFRARVLHIPTPKGGEIKAFDIPLSKAMFRCLVRTMRIGRAVYGEQSLEWLFPAESESGHIIEHKEKRSDLSKWGNDLRQTFRTIAQGAGVAELDVHLLMKHSIPGVNAGYITRNKLLSDHLRQQQEAISRRILDAGRLRRRESNPLARCWPALPSRRTLSDLMKEKS